MVEQKAAPGPTEAPLTSREPGDLTLHAVIHIAARSWLITFVVLIVGGIAVEFLGHIFGEMNPSLPAFFLPYPEVERAVASRPSAPSSWYTFALNHRFALIFWTIFLGNSFVKLGRVSASVKLKKTACAFEKCMGWFSEHWFDLLVVNAFGAFIGSMIISVLEDFSYIKWCIHWVLQALHPAIHWCISMLFNTRQIETAQGLISWYENNEVKFLFWGLYLASIADDLGLPNLKTMAAIFWEKVRSAKAGKDQMRK